MNYNRIKLEIAKRVFLIASKNRSNKKAIKAVDKFFILKN